MSDTSNANSNNNELASPKKTGISSPLETQQIVKIAISKIMPNEDQPRHRFRLHSIQQMADSLKSLGQQTPLKVRPLTEVEKASYSKWDILDHGDNMPPDVPGHD